MARHVMLYQSVLPALHDVLEPIRQNKSVDEVVRLILEKACSLARATHGSFVLVDHESQRLTIGEVFGWDWTSEKKACQLAIGQGLTGRVAATGTPLLCCDTTQHPDYYPLFDYVRSELIVPVVVKNQVWGLINIDDSAPNAFDATTLQLLTVFADLAAFAIRLQLELTEHQRLHQKLLQSEKLAALGEALAGVAHEINNPLTAILAYATLLQGSPTHDESRTATTVIAAEAQRAAALLRGLLEFSRQDSGEHQSVDLEDLVRQVIALRKPQLDSRRIRVHVRRLGAGACRLAACPPQIQQVILNLLTNAEQAIPPARTDGTIAFTLRRAGDRAILTLADNGTGIPPDVAKKIFDPFFTTKPPGQGTGLGLSIAFAIVEAHGGALRLADSSPAGTTFLLELPADSALAQLPPDNAEPLAAGF